MWLFIVVAVAALFYVMFEAGMFMHGDNLVDDSRP
jgi:hypothetical protein